MIISILLLPLVSIILVNCQDLRSTGELCAGSTTKISCNSNEVLFITSVINTYSDECSAFNAGNNNKFSKCESKYMHNLNDICTGKQSCIIKLEQYDNVIGLHKSTCIFKSNKVNVFYVCVPKANNAYDKVITMCGSPAVISSKDVKSAFIRSPGYPEYYGNNRACALQIKMESNTRINMFLLNMNMEGLGLFSRVPKDYLKISTDSTDQQLYGSLFNRIVHNTTETVNLRFASDFITTTSLSKPKGFLLYIQTSSTLKPTLPPTTTPAPTTTTNTIYFDDDFGDYEKNDVGNGLGAINNVEQTTTTTEETNADFENIVGFINDKYSNPNLPNQKEGSKKVYMICLLVALAGLLVIAVTSILLIIRRRKILRYRRQRQDESDYYDGSSKVYENITDSSPKKVEILNETIGNEKKVEADLASKQENIYSPSPVFIETIKIVKSSDQEDEPTKAANENNLSINSEEIYEKISEFYPSSDNEETSVSKMYDSTEEIYARPTNIELTKDDLNKLREEEEQQKQQSTSVSVLDATLDTSTTQLLKNNDQKC